MRKIYIFSKALFDAIKFQLENNQPLVFNKTSFNHKYKY